MVEAIEQIRQIQESVEYIKTVLLTWERDNRRLPRNKRDHRLRKLCESSLHDLQAEQKFWTVADDTGSLPTSPFVFLGMKIAWESGLPGNPFPPGPRVEEFKKRVLELESQG